MKKKISLLLIIITFLKVEAQTSTFIQIDSLVQTGRYKIALSELEKLPATFLTNIKIASIYDAIDDHKRASDYYQKALLIKDDYLTKIKYGKSLKKEGKRLKAIQVFEEIKQIDEDNLLVNYELGKLYLQTKQGQKAKQILKKMIAQDPNNANYSYQLGLAYSLLKKRNLKINNFLNAYKKDSSHFKSIEKLARAFTKLRDKDSANLFITKGLFLNPNHIDLNRLKINNLYREKEYEKALTYLKHIDSLEPKEHYTQKMLAKAYYNLEDLENAKKHFKTAYKLDRNDYKSHTYLGHVFLKEEDMTRAIYSYMAATLIAKEPRDEEHLGLANVYYKMELPKKVLEHYKKATEENSNNYNALYLFAKFSDDYYKDKKIGYNLYKKYLNRFEGKSAKNDEFIKHRISTIKKEYFLKGEELE
ncbi:tetratricopeptide repeat protein [Tenacibaculum adriaticum]|uniref:Tetratricopeptide repeat protein n=1 Tax=Tenacibaculum adriaticum TaxID=413713 RepID=A0A5S5DX04_9FLAO|nr:tetratricopeptide repeat protein [Tenacibaculum adriaticum]TYQ00468.1 tetratricopeptide repeat protein [Tenacibaculum adriaticum]